MERSDGTPTDKQFMVSDMLAIVALRDADITLELETLFSAQRTARVAALLGYINNSKDHVVGEWESMAAYLPDAARSLIRQYPSLIVAAKPVEDKMRTGDMAVIDTALIAAADRMGLGMKCAVEKKGEEKPAFTRQNATVTVGRGRQR